MHFILWILLFILVLIIAKYNYDNNSVFTVQKVNKLKENILGNNVKDEIKDEIKEETNLNSNTKSLIDGGGRSDDNVISKNIEIEYNKYNPKDPSEIYDYKVSYGEEIDNTITRYPPLIRFKDADENKKYMITLVDPDSPSHDNPIYKEWRHMCVGNIPGMDLIKGGKFTNPEKYTIISDYSPLTPVIQTGYHRYYLKIYEQPGHIEDYPVLTIRKCWKSSDFAEQFKLKKVGQFFFLSKKDEGRIKKDTKKIIEILNG